MNILKTTWNELETVQNDTTFKDPWDKARANAIAYGRDLLNNGRACDYGDYLKKMRTFVRKIHCAGLIDDYFDERYFDTGNDFDWNKAKPSFREINDPEASRLFRGMWRHLAAYGKITPDNMRQRIREMPRELLTLNTHYKNRDLPATILMRNVFKKKVFLGSTEPTASGPQPPDAPERNFF